MNKDRGNATVTPGCARVSPMGSVGTKRMIVALTLFASSLVSHHALAAKPELTVGISPDLPPYVMQNATQGMEVDIVRQALAEYTVRFVQLPYKADRYPQVCSGHRYYGGA